MSDLVISGLRKRFGSVVALDGVDLAVSAGEFFVVLGPSAAGKTTLLRSIAGLERPESGHILFAAAEMTTRPVQGRDMAMIFQTFALYPHLTAYENLAYPLREARVEAREIARRVGEIAEMLRVGHALQRKPATLSGGEQQRVAIARALANKPALLLADEPTGNLDEHTADEVFGLLVSLVREAGLGALIATHNTELARRMDRRLALHEGRVQQV